ncbi:MAG: TIGR03087 family PEP-CTERM/XrtA system glycosyltransferase [Acidobacteria bacterium]|nr:TIGR03087 family PEP-CTERM/XrtA system glycosyltransferase [Acidobacteriota bacterium]MBI3423486.1 TIGR03087 family PEP-CTERM/XrtA system glycosyltransferase [Acidobacteriota bacterium]
MLNILYICHRFPFPPKRGGKIRPFNMIRHLSERGHGVTVCSLARSDGEAHEGAGIAPYCARYAMARVHAPQQTARMVGRLFTPGPSSMGYFYAPALKRTIDELLASQHFDLIFVHCSSVAPYVTHVRHIPKLLDFGDMDSQKWLEYARYKPFPLALGYWLEGVKLQHAEKQLAAQFDLCTVTTRAELETLERFGTASDCAWFPNGVDAEYFQPDGTAYDPDVLSFIGRMDYYPNQECMLRFCAQTWPHIRAQRPNARLLIVGAEPAPAIRKLGELPGIEVTGSVPDVRPYVLRSAAMIAPLSIARGTQNKILEALALGVPVITSAVAVKGVDAEPEQHLLVGNAPEEYAQAALRLMNNADERARLAAAGRARMLSHHNWTASLERMESLVERCVTRQ